LLSNALILAVILVFVLQSPNATSDSKILSANSASEPAAVANPLDQLSSADIALTVARMRNLP